MSKEKYVGLDVHKATIVIAVINAVGQLVMQTVIATDAQMLREFFKGLSGTVHVALEEGTQSAWLYALLRPLVKDVVVCNPRHNKLIETGNKSDRIDAEKLAQLLRMGSLKVVYKGNQEQRQLKDLARAYQNLVSDSTRVMNRIKAIYRGRGINCDGHNIYKPDQRQSWLDKLPEEGARFRSLMLFEQLEKLSQLRQAAKQEFLHQGKRQPEYSICAACRESVPCAPRCCWPLSGSRIAFAPSGSSGLTAGCRSSHGRAPIIKSSMARSVNGGR